MSADHHLRPRSLAPLALVASLAMVLVVVQVPPCGMSAEACAVAARPAAGSHCPMAAALETASRMECCVGDAAPPNEPVPAVPASADDLRVQLKAPAPALALSAARVASPPVAVTVRGSAATPAAPGAPLYTLLSTLLI